MSCGTVTVTLQLLVAVNECGWPSSGMVVGEMEQPDNMKFAVGPPEPFEIVSVKFTVEAKATGMPPNKPERRRSASMARSLANVRLRA